MNPLPAEAELLVARIESLLDQASRLHAEGGGDEAAFGLRETERRYLPDTLQAYADIPPARRDAVAEGMLVDQLRLLERATAQRLAILAESAQTQLAANGTFLSERFGPLAALPADDGAPFEPGDAPPATLVRRMLERIETEGGPSPGSLLARAAEQLAAAFPTIATVTHGGFLGRGPVESIALDVPRRDDLLRYMLARAPHGGVEASVTRFLRGIKNKTLRVEIGEWTRGLIDDLGAYVARERGVRESLNRIFREQR